jgi:hypothetical protein
MWISTPDVGFAARAGTMYAFGVTWSRASLCLVALPLLGGCGERDASALASGAGATAGQSGPEVYRGLRAQALSTAPETVGVQPGADVAAYGLIADWRMDDSWQATLVCMVDGTTSLYLSDGGGYVGVGSREEIASASITAVKLAADAYEHLARTDEVPDPAPNCMRFTLLTSKGKRSAQAWTDELMGGEHPLSTLAAHVQGVITLIRESSPGP